MRRPKFSKNFSYVLAVVVAHGFELGGDLLLDAAGDQLELAVVLEHLARDVEREVLRVDKALHKAEVIGQQVGALLHDQNAGSVELQTLFIVAGVVVHRRLGRDEQQRVVGRGALGRRVDHLERVLPVVELLLVEVVVLLGRDLVFVLLPQRHHAVERLDLKIVLVLVLRALLRPRLFDLHADRVADVVGVLLHKARAGGMYRGIRCTFRPRCRP